MNRLRGGESLITDKNLAENSLFCVLALKSLVQVGFISCFLALEIRIWDF